jgi:hypothetical protein
MVVFYNHFMEIWPQQVVDAGVKDAGGTYRPRVRGARCGPVFNGAENGEQLLSKMIACWREPGAEYETPGIRRIIDQAGIGLTWEYALVDVTRQWAKYVPKDVRDRINAYLVSVS